MKSYRVIKPFHDIRAFSKVYAVGEIIQFDDDRANRLLTLGLVEQVKPQRNRVKFENK